MERHKGFDHCSIAKLDTLWSDQQSNWDDGLFASLDFSPNLMGVLTTGVALIIRPAISGC